MGARGQAQHLDLTSVCFEYAVKLLGLFRRAAPIVLALYQQGRRGTPVRITDGRAACVDVRYFVGSSTQLRVCKPHPDITHPVKAKPVGDWVFGNGGFEPVRVSYDPSRQVSAT